MFSLYVHEQFNFVFLLPQDILLSAPADCILGYSLVFHFFSSVTFRF